MCGRAGGRSVEKCGYGCLLWSVADVEWSGQTDGTVRHTIWTWICSVALRDDAVHARRERVQGDLRPVRKALKGHLWRSRPIVKEPKILWLWVLLLPRKRKAITGDFFPTNIFLLLRDYREQRQNAAGTSSQRSPNTDIPICQSLRIVYEYVEIGCLRRFSIFEALLEFTQCRGLIRCEVALGHVRFRTTRSVGEQKDLLAIHDLHNMLLLQTNGSFSNLHFHGTHVF